MRRAARRDANEGRIVAALRAEGWVVEQVSSAGHPDLLLTRRGLVDVMEVKQYAHSPMTPAQVVVHARWERGGCRIPVVTDEVEAIEVLAGKRPPRTYRDFPWEGVTGEEKARRLRGSPATG